MNALLTATGVCKYFSGIAALDDVDIEVRRGELLGLIGPNGAGKSTLFNCLSGVTHPDAGRIYYDGFDLTRLPPHRLARLGMARTFQQIELFTGLTVADHLLVALRAQHAGLSVVNDLLGRSRPTAAERARTAHVLELVGLSRDADRPVESLGLGRARVVELARALVCDPQLLFLDEPTSGLNDTETRQMATVLEQVRRERSMSVLLCEHDVPFVERLAQRTIVLDCGRRIADGPTAEVLDHPEVRAAYLGVQE